MFNSLPLSAGPRGTQAALATIDDRAARLIVETCLARFAPGLEPDASRENDVIEVTT